MSNSLNIIALGTVPQLLFKLAGGNLQSTSDQPFSSVLYSGSAYVVTTILARQRSGGASVTCAGGIYDTSAKAGNAIVAAAQSWVTLASGVIVSATLATVATTVLLVNTPILSLTTGSTAACTADFYIYGLDIS
jgi:hypothetical protein